MNGYKVNIHKTTPFLLQIFRKHKKGRRLRVADSECLLGRLSTPSTA